MTFLLDTHVFLWYVAADARLPAGFREAIDDLENDVALSAVAIWEIVIKSQLGRLPVPSPAAEYAIRQRDAHGIRTLPIDDGAMTQLERLPVLHRDSFDRLLVAQALQHGMTLMTVDSRVIAYPVPIFAASDNESP